MPAHPRAIEANFALGAVLILAACDSGAEGRKPAPSESAVITIDSVVLDEGPAGAVVHRPNRLYVDDRGEILISEFTSASVLRFDRAGGFLGSIGSSGRGPGEFVTPAMIATLGDTIMVFDVGRRDAQLFARDGTYLDSSFPVPFIANDVAITDSAVWVQGISFESPWTALRWRRSDGMIEWSVAKPDEWTNYPLLASLGGAHLAFLGDRSSWAVFSGLDLAIRSWAAGSRADSFALPRLHRRGVPLAKVAEGGYRSPRELFAEASGVADASALSDGGASVLFLDMTIDGNTRGGTYYLTTLGPDGGATCVDVKLEFGPYSQVRPRLRGDTLIALIQRDTQAGGILSLIKRWVIDPASCGARP